MLSRIYVKHRGWVFTPKHFLDLGSSDAIVNALKDRDIALVLAPIFKPSTIGVIKDDGGPISLGDFISRLSGK